MGNLFWGALITAIGLFRHQSNFFGDFSVFNDWIGKGTLEWRGRDKRKTDGPAMPPGPGAARGRADVTTESRSPTCRNP